MDGDLTFYGSVQSLEKAALVTGGKKPCRCEYVREKISVCSRAKRKKKLKFPPTDADENAKRQQKLRKFFRSYVVNVSRISAAKQKFY